MGNLKMSRKRKSFSNEFKAKVAIEAIKGQKTIAEIASEFEVHTTQVINWKKHMLEGAADTFSKKLENKEAEHEKEKEHLYSQIGQLKVEADWLSKKLKMFN